MKVYISGPMSGIKDFNYPAFEAAERCLIRDGYEPVSPHRAPKMEAWEDYMRFDIKLLCDCDAIMMLPGWEGSRGANLEYQVASAIGCKISIGLPEPKPSHESV